MPQPLVLIECRRQDLNLHDLCGHQALNLVSGNCKHIGAGQGPRWKFKAANHMRPFRTALALYRRWVDTGNSAPQLPPKTSTRMRFNHRVKDSIR